MEPCTRCGGRDEHRMIALMSRWFAVHAGVALEGGYFYLCPACYDERIAPEYPAILTAIQEHQKPDRVASREAAATAAAAPPAPGPPPGPAAGPQEPPDPATSAPSG